MKIFFTAFTQVCLISINTYFISKTNMYGAIVTTFMINMVWTYNVKRISCGNLKESLIYSLGASTGVIFGLLIISKFI